MRKNIFLQGERIILRPLLESDIQGNYQFWLNDMEVIKYNSHGRFPMTESKLLNYVKTVQTNNTSLVLAIEDIETSTHLGNISLQAINWIDRNAEVAFLLGEKSFWGKGIMLEAGLLMINHAFRGLNLHRVHCGTSSANKGMQKLAKKLGMKEEGIRKEAFFKGGVYHDIIEYGIVNAYEIL